MPGEINVAANLGVANGNKSTSRTFSARFDQNNAGFYCNVQNIGTSDENLTVATVTTVGWLWLHNLDTVNYVEWREATATQYLGRMQPNDVVLFRGAPTLGDGGGAPELEMKANSAAVDIEVLILEN